MNIGNRWTATISEISVNHYCGKALDRQGRSIELEGSDEQEILKRLHVDAYLYDHMVLNKFLIDSLCKRRAIRPLHKFLNGYFALDDTRSGWVSFLESIASLRLLQDDLTAEELVAIGELHDSLILALPLLLEQAEQG